MKQSVFVQHSGAVCDFSSSDSWVILSPIEQSIKRKIEAVGTPLKDWDIQINYGIKTGYNDAFIIDTEKREAILANCQTEEERKRTAELIRPILRGRDIRRYGYKWAELWIINIHNGIKGKLPRIKIEDYPAIKAHLDLYWDKISKRTDKGDTPYNLRNCAYMDIFIRPLIRRNALIVGFVKKHAHRCMIRYVCIRQWHTPHGRKTKKTIEAALPAVWLLY